MVRTPFRDGSQYLLLEEQEWRQEQRVIGMHRLGMEPELKNLSASFNMGLAESAKERNGHKYIGNITWKQGICLNLILGVETPTLREFLDVYHTLDAGRRGERDIYDGLGKKVDEKEATKWFNELFGRRKPYRAAWLDAHFVKRGKSLYLEQQHNFSESGLVPSNSSKLLPYLHNSGWLDVSSVNKQGLAVRKSAEKKLYGFSPEENTVARFDANSGGASLSCGGDPAGSDSNLGVIASASRERAPFKL